MVAAMKSIKSGPVDCLIITYTLGYGGGPEALHTAHCGTATIEAVAGNARVGDGGAGRVVGHVGRGGRAVHRGTGVLTHDTCNNKTFRLTMG